MFATLCESTNDFSSQHVTIDSLQSDHVVAGAADTWDDYTSSIREAIVDALTARTLALREYAKLQAVADSARLQVDLNSSSHLVREALLHQTACTNRAHTLKVLIEQYNMRVSTLKSQLAFWQNQLPA